MCLDFRLGGLMNFQKLKQKHQVLPKKKLKGKKLIEFWVIMGKLNKNCSREGKQGIYLPERCLSKNVH